MKNTIVKDGKTVRRCNRAWGLRAGRKTIIELKFQLTTPNDYFDPAEDEVLLLDLLDNIFLHLTDFHDVPGFKLVGYTVNGRKVV